jgi:molybdate transport system permease protein
MSRGGRWLRILLIGLAVVYLLLAVGPLVGLFLYAPLADIMTQETRTVVWRALALTLRSSVVATAAAVLLGLPAAVCLARLEFRGKNILNALIEVPIALPPVVMGVALLLTWGRRGLVGQVLTDYGVPLSFTSTAVVIAQFVVASPYFVRIAKTAIGEVPRALEDASMSLGAGPLRTYLKVTLPLARTGVLAAIVTCWARAMGEFGATILFAGNFPGRTQTLPLAIFTTMQYDLGAAIALALVMLGFSLVAFVAAQVGLNAAHLRASGEP